MKYNIKQFETIEATFIKTDAMSFVSGGYGGNVIHFHRNRLVKLARAAGLDERQRSMLLEYLVHRKTQTEIAKKHAVSTSRAYQIINKSLRIIKIYVEKELVEANYSLTPDFDDFPWLLEDTDLKIGIVAHQFNSDGSYKDHGRVAVKFNDLLTDYFALQKSVYGNIEAKKERTRLIKELRTVIKRIQDEPFEGDCEGE
jgi:predicted DNA-binding protein YlxM (UPF0122 family)